MSSRPLRKKNRRKTSLGNRQVLGKTLPKSGQKYPSSFKSRTFREKITAQKGRRFVFTWKKLLIGACIAFGLLVLSAVGVFAYYVRDLPNPKVIETRAISQSTQIFDRNGKNLYNIHGEENRTIVKGDQINDYLKKATIAVEDANFYNHHGFDIRGIGRSFISRLTHRGLEGGGSTITQQYIKNALLSRDQTVDRKLKELILAIEVEQIYTKDEILTGYLNQIPYGSNAYGIEAAAQTYFNKPSKDLTLSEAATLAAIPQAPTYFSPYGNHLDDLFTRKNYVLDRMAKVGFITQVQADKAKTEAPNNNSPTFRSQNDLLAPHFVFYVREKLVEALGESDPQLAEQKVDSGGYKVTSSLDLDTQQMAQGIMSDMGPGVIKKYNATNAALVAVDPKNGEILAMVGSIDYNKSKSGNTNFANALLQPGSSFKPIVYATAFGKDYKYAPSSITFDLPTDFGNYKPNNYDGQFRGPVTNRQALAGSLNIPAVKNLYLAGIPQSIATAKGMGISTLNRSVSDYGLSLVLGSGEVKPVEMADAYAAFANGGTYHPLRPILKIEKDGKLIKDYTTDTGKKALEPEVAYEISSILSDNVARSYIFGLHNNLTLSDRPVAAKSGTTENNRDAWTIGFTPSLSVAVWVGNNEANKTMVKGADGSYVAAPIWNRFMREYLKGKPVEAFNRPADIKEVTVDKLSGKLPNDQSPADQHLTDIFAPWQVPTESDNVHTKVKIDKVSGKLATDLTPADQIEERTYVVVHSEAPDKPGWEQAVREWAKSVGGDVLPPTEKDDLHTEGNRPTLTFTTPLDGGTVSGSFSLAVTPGGSEPIQKVEFFINNVSVGSVSQAPWSITYDASSLPVGSQIIQATVTNSIGLTKSAQITVSTSKPSTPPAEVQNPSATDGSKSLSKPILLNWTTPAAPDVAKIQIYQSTSSDPTPGTKLSVLSATPGTSQSDSIDPTNLTAGQTYYFLIHTVNTAGIESVSSTKVSAKVLP